MNNNKDEQTENVYNKEDINNNDLQQFESKSKYTVQTYLTTYGFHINHSPSFSANSSTSIIELNMRQADVKYYPKVISQKDSYDHYKKLTSLSCWKTPNLVVFGREVHASRQTCSFGSNPNKVYRYSGTTARVDSAEYPDSVKVIQQKIENILNEKFDFVLLNWYKNGNDCIGEHSDVESDLVKNGVITCISLGAKRKFVFKNKKNKKLIKNIELENGSMIVMRGQTQQYWKHSIPKQKKIEEGRISLTFRQLR